MKRLLLLAPILLTSCGRETTPPNTFNGQELTQTMTITVNSVTSHEPPNIEIRVVGVFPQKDAAPLTIYSVACSGEYRQLYLEGVGIFQCDVGGDEGEARVPSPNAV